jgi:SPP1 gp7 family putative phage head morphogenesis protein
MEPWQRLPFAQAIAYFRAKLNIDTDTWRDIQGIEHDAFFVVAGAKGALLQSLRDAVDRAIAEGTTLEQFRQEFEAIVQRTGWTFTGGSAWRSAIILETNLRASYAAGRQEQMQSVKADRPYWLWRHGGSRDPRLAHLALDGKVFAADDPFWRSFGTPPQGYGCRCQIFSLSQADVDRLGLTVERGPSLSDRLPVPGGGTAELTVAEGWGNIHGSTPPERRAELARAVVQRLDPDLGTQVLQDINAYDRDRGITNG